ncbi:MAG: GNAT family N-acetyltransferase [Spirochaetes bacterium RBG_16_67_19]|nr:MAG: GNAT family N-acetyltransferase [Spirochaetes bacterium GWB1_66_5]OHD76802.1 MAG: GNAT family N-acetyltransferase [Spirochaetes bacterium RBG_16_67_19]
MKIRKLLPGDLEALARLHRQFWDEASSLDRMKARYEELASNPKYILLCATMDEVVVGSVMGIVCDELYGECKPFLVMENLVVDAGFRRHGIGKALLSELEKKAREWKCSQILFITEADRKDAVSFYKSAGYNAQKHIGFKKSLE